MQGRSFFAYRIEGNTMRYRLIHPGVRFLLDQGLGLMEGVSGSPAKDSR